MLCCLTVQKLAPEYVIVYGDTNSSMAAALVAKDVRSKIIHLEAGVRDYDYKVPEEHLRIKIDEMANFLFLHLLIFVEVIYHMNRLLEQYIMKEI